MNIVEASSHMMRGGYVRRSGEDRVLESPGSLTCYPPQIVGCPDEDGAVLWMEDLLTTDWIKCDRFGNPLAAELTAAADAAEKGGAK